MGTTQDYENYFFEISGYENPMVEKTNRFIPEFMKRLSPL